MRVRSRLTFALVLLVAASALSGCVDNMGELKEVLGFVETPPPPPPVEPPTVKAQANATTVLAGVPIRFTSEGTRDPAGLALEFSWDFGDGKRGEGPVAVHAFAEPGEYVVTLRVENSGGAAETDVLNVVAEQANRAPVALFHVKSGARNVTTADAGAPLAFDASGSYDLDGDELSHLWDFGNGKTSFEARPTHAYAAPGLYTVRLKVDDGVRSAEASRLLAINGTLRAEGTFRVQDAQTRTHALPVPDGLRQVVIELRFPGALGANDLRLVVRDAQGDEVLRLGEETPAASQDDQVRAATLVGDALRGFESGTWGFEVQREKGVDVSYVLTVRENY